MRLLSHATYIAWHVVILVRSPSLWLRSDSTDKGTILIHDSSMTHLWLNCHSVNLHGVIFNDIQVTPQWLQNRSPPNATCIHAKLDHDSSMTDFNRKWKSHVTPNVTKLSLMSDNTIRWVARPHHPGRAKKGSLPEFFPKFFASKLCCPTAHDIFSSSSVEVDGDNTIEVMI